VVIWSALSKAVAFLTTLKIGNAIEYAVDIINPSGMANSCPSPASRSWPPNFCANIAPIT